MNVQRTETDVLIIGGGPAGALLGYLLARQGRRVMVAEKEHDLERFATEPGVGDDASRALAWNGASNVRLLDAARGGPRPVPSSAARRGLERDWRGETIAARSVRTLLQLGFGPALERHGYLPLTGLSLREAGRSIVSVDYRRFAIRALPIDIPQPALIATFFQQATTYRDFTLLAGTRFVALCERNGQVVGARLERPSGRPLEVRAKLVVGADGRFSEVRAASGLRASIAAAERSFLWFKVKRPRGWGYEAQLVVDGREHLLIHPTFPDHLRIGFSLPTGGLDALHAEGLARFRARVASLDSRLAPLLDAHIGGWDDTAYDEIFTAELVDWARDGLVLIGDASHTASPLLGQGVNLALQDAVFLAPVVSAFFEGGAAGVLPKRALDPFVGKRRAHKQMITRFQRAQERTLRDDTPLGRLLRRARLRVLDLFPLKYRVLDRVLNAPHECDPELGHAAVL
ncbi:MAG: FAD-dependent monooxygenase [Polyangiales bacterium]